MGLYPIWDTLSCDSVAHLMGIKVDYASVDSDPLHSCIDSGTLIHYPSV